MPSLKDNRRCALLEQYVSYLHYICVPKVFREQRFQTNMHVSTKKPVTTAKKRGYRHESGKH